MPPEPTSSHVIAALADVVGRDQVVAPVPAEYLTDATGRGLRGQAAALVRPADAAQAAAVVRVCYDNDLPITPRGGGSGVSGGAVPAGGIVLRSG
jgi:FAD/FMN-containing dehydrogenase